MSLVVPLHPSVSEWCMCEKISLVSPRCHMRKLSNVKYYFYIDASLDGVDTKFVEEAVRELLEARRVLKSSYVYGFFLDGNKEKKTIFELMQVLQRKQLFFSVIHSSFFLLPSPFILFASFSILRSFLSCFVPSFVTSLLVSYLRSFLLFFVPSFHPFVVSFLPSCYPSLVFLFVRSFVRLFHPFLPSFAHPFDLSTLRSFIFSFVCSFLFVIVCSFLHSFFLC